MAPEEKDLETPQANRQPLAAVLTYKNEWWTLSDADAVRGLPASVVLFLRKPTPEERDTLEECLRHPALSDPFVANLYDVGKRALLFWPEREARRLKRAVQDDADTASTEELEAAAALHDAWTESGDLDWREDLIHRVVAGIEAGLRTQLERIDTPVEYTGHDLKVKFELVDKGVSGD